MISLRNLTTLLSFCFALTSLALKASPAQGEGLCPKPDAHAKGEGSVSYYLDQAKVAAAQSQWEVAESCLADGHAIDPKNRDIAFYSARVKAWQGKHDEASVLIKSWPASDAESREIRGDLAWYRNDVNEAESWYRSSINPAATVDSWKVWLKALRAKKDKHFESALARALNRYPEDDELKAWSVEKDGVAGKMESDVIATPVPKLKQVKVAKKIENDRATYRAALSGTLIRETQNQSLHAVDADATVIAERKSLSVGASQVTRDYGPPALSDKSYRLGLGFGLVHDPSNLIQSEETTVNGGGSPDPDFSPLRSLNIRHELFLSETFSLLGELGARWYRDVYVRTAMLGSSVGAGHYRYAARFYNTQAKHNDSSFYLSAAYQGLQIRPEVFLKGGRDAASRPYLFDLENDSFFAIGAQLDYRYSRQWASRAIYEQRWENGFHQESFSLVLLWYDR
ncbi:MAG: hypothetical protein H7318_00250 [Oligoflexus sp.]|nr:hypothetical protein [Oligoflexus sp.]